MHSEETALVSLPLLIKATVLIDQGSAFMTSFNLSHFLQGPTSTGGLGLQHMDLGFGETGKFIVVYSYFHSNVCGICSDDPCFIPGTGHLCLLYFLIWLGVYPFH